VWEEEGPIPIENRSKVEMTACSWSASLYVPVSDSSSASDFCVAVVRPRASDLRTVEVHGREVRLRLGASVLTLAWTGKSRDKTRAVGVE
jgi:hypothetical protein